MNDYLSRLAGRALGVPPVVQPYVPPRFTPPEQPTPRVLEVDAEVPAMEVAPPPARAPVRGAPMEHAPEAAPVAPAPPSVPRLLPDEPTAAWAPVVVERMAPGAAPTDVETRAGARSPAPAGVPSASRERARGDEAIAPAQLVTERTIVLPPERIPDRGEPRHVGEVVVQRDLAGSLPSDAPSFKSAAFAEPPPQPQMPPPRVAVARAPPSAPSAVREPTRREPAAPAEPPVVRVTIGRIELRGATPTRPAAPAPRASAPAPRSTLDEYLRQRARRPQGGTP